MKFVSILIIFTIALVCVQGLRRFGNSYGHKDANETKQPAQKKENSKENSNVTKKSNKKAVKAKPAAKKAVAKQGNESAKPAAKKAANKNNQAKSPAKKVVAAKPAAKKAAAKPANQTQSASHVKPKAFALKSYLVNIELDGKQAGNATFTIDSITKPQQNHNIGWFLNFGEENPSQEFEEYLQQEEKHYYLPYRIIVGDITYVNPFGAPKYFEFLVTDPKGAIHKVATHLPFANNKNFINDEEATHLKGLLNNIIARARAKLNDYKKTASVQASNYINIKPFSDASDKGDQQLAAVLKTANAETDALAVIIKSDSENYNELRKEYDGLERQYYTLKNRLNYYNDRISESKNLRIAKISLAKMMKDKKAADVKGKLGQETEKYKGLLNTAIKHIEGEIPGVSKSLEEAKKFILDKLDLGNYQNLAAKLYAGN